MELAAVAVEQPFEYEVDWAMAKRLMADEKKMKKNKRTRSIHCVPGMWPMAMDDDEKEVVIL